MRRVIKTFTALALVALAAVAVSYAGSAAPKKLGPSAAAPNAGPAGADEAAPRRHAQARGEGRRRHDRPARQLHAPVLAALPGDLRRAARVREGGRKCGLHGRSRPRNCRSDTDERRQDVDVQASERDQVLERPGGDDERRRRLAQAHLQGQEPDLGRFLLRHRRRRRVPEDARHLHAQGRRLRERCGPDGDDQPHGARPRVQVQALGPAREHPAGEYAGEGRRHEADSRHRPVLLQVVQPQPEPRHGPQPLLQGVVGQGAAGRLPGSDHADLRAHRRGADHGDPERAGRLDARAAARGPALRDRHEVREPGARHPADGVLVHPDEHEHGALQQAEGAAGVQLRGRPERGGEDLRRQEPRVAVVPGAPARLPGAQGLLPVHEEPGHEVVGAGRGEGEAARQGVRHGSDRR